MENQEKKVEEELLHENDRRINLILSDLVQDDEAIDFGKVFRAMKAKKRLYAWVLLLCMLVGVCVPLLLYQLNQPPLIVSSVVTLTYDVDDEPVSTLVAPDGTNLDLNMISSSYVLQNALNRIMLSQEITVDNLRSNISISRTLTEESVRQQEVLSAMRENKSNDLYRQIINTAIEYTNTFVVSLENGFGDELSFGKIMLQENELQLLLDQILISYNEYMVRTYANLVLPDDKVALINKEELDIPEIVIQLESAIKSLSMYCQMQPDQVRKYRSSRTGYSLEDLMHRVDTILRVDVEYLSVYVFSNKVARDQQEMVDNQRYLLQTAQMELMEIEENISAIKALLNSYRNDTIFISSMDNEVTEIAQANTQYYNDLLGSQAANEQLFAQKKEEIKEIEMRLNMLSSVGDAAGRETAEAEIDRVYGHCQKITGQIRDHMQEVIDSTFYHNLTRHSAALGKTQNFLAACWKRMLIGLAVGAVLGCGIWFLTSFLPEIFGEHKPDRKVEAVSARGEEKA